LAQSRVVIACDDKVFLKTGSTIENIDLMQASWPRVYAVGDVRSGSVKQVASGVGDGSVMVQYIHRALAGT